MEVILDASDGVKSRTASLGYLVANVLIQASFDIWSDGPPVELCVPGEVEEAFPIVVSLHAPMVGSSRRNVAFGTKKMEDRAEARSRPLSGFRMTRRTPRRPAAFHADAFAGVNPALTALSGCGLKAPEAQQPTRNPEAP